MKTTALTILLLFSALFAFATQEQQPADVLGLRWGMTVEEVNAVRPLSQDKPGSNYYGAGTIKIGEQDYDVVLTLTPNNGLEKVLIDKEGASVELFMAILRLIETRYKAPPKVGGDELIRSAHWQLPRAKVSLLLSSEVLILTYTARPGYDIIDQL